jgi:hypothetical protein
MALGLTQPPTTEYQKYLLGGKCGRCVWLTTVPPSCADFLEIWEPKPPGTLWAWVGLNSHCSTFSTTSEILQVPFVAFCAWSKPAHLEWVMGKIRRRVFCVYEAAQYSSVWMRYGVMQFSRWCQWVSVDPTAFRKMGGIRFLRNFGARLPEFRASHSKQIATTVTAVRNTVSFVWCWELK